MSCSPTLMLEHFSFQYPFTHNPALNDISFRLLPGKTLGIIGPSASGKTSLLYAIAGILQKHFPAGITSGTIARDGTQPVVNPSEIGFVFQDPYMQLSGVTETVETEIAFSLEQLAIPQHIIRARIDEQISQFQLGHLALRHPRSLSGGETRLLALACETAKHPRWLLLDQPTESLHSEGIRFLTTLLNALKLTTNIIMVDHRLEVIAAVCGRVLFLHHGEQQFFGTPPELFTSAIDTNELDIPLWIDAQRQLTGRAETLLYRKSLRMLQQWH